MTDQTDAERDAEAKRIKEEMTQNGVLYPLGKDYWGHRRVDFSMDGETLFYQRESPELGVKAFLTTKLNNNNVSTVDGLVLGIKGDVLERYDSVIVSKSEVLTRITFLQSEIDFKYFNNY